MTPRDEWDLESLATAAAAGGLALIGNELARRALGIGPAGAALAFVMLSALAFALIRLTRHRLTAILRRVLDHEAEDGDEPTGTRRLGRELNGLIKNHREALQAAHRHQTEAAALRAALLRVGRELGANEFEPSADPQEWIEAIADHRRREAGTLAARSERLRDVARRIAEGVRDQEETVGKTTSTVEALSEEIDRISRNADEAALACSESQREARQGLEQLRTVIEGIERLREAVESNARKARRLGDRSVEIGAIVQLIGGLAQRTDMLALNATIESVRAGEHGRGFAVVADEIRKLAERGADSTREIATLVEAIQADVNEGLRATEEEQAEMAREAERIAQALSVLERIQAVAERSSNLVQGISNSATGQVVATRELVRAIQRFSEVSHRSGVLAEEACEPPQEPAVHRGRLDRPSGARSPVIGNGPTRPKSSQRSQTPAEPLP